MVHLHRPGGSALLRLPLLLLAAAVLPACEGPRDDVRVTVFNQGAVSVRMRTDVEQSSSDDEEDEAVITAGSSASFEYDHVRRLKLGVWRESDGLVLFAADWDEEDLRREDDFISVTVNP